GGGFESASLSTPCADCPRSLRDLCANDQSELLFLEVRIAPLSFRPVRRTSPRAAWRLEYRRCRPAKRFGEWARPVRPPVLLRRRKDLSDVWSARTPTRHHRCGRARQPRNSGPPAVSD